MNIKSPSRLINLLVVASTAGCVFPYRFTSRPGVIGDVVDSRTGLAISDAEVSLYRGKLIPLPKVPGRATTIRDAPMPDAVAVTDVAGHFALQAERFWALYVIPGDYFPKPWLVSVSRQGYVPINIDIWHSVYDNRIENAGHIVIIPTP